ncbi:MAG TPA: ABC transporter ATP-binding protein [Candidatus Limnocylindria bacterium]|nr:ABC transporter ATP-binding protein [Candidatus Limnocylindria bacterium]
MTATRTTPPALEARSLSFVYPDGTRALDGVELTVRPGERVAIIGQNGSGKSTLVRHFNGLLRATDGEVRVNGESVGNRHVAALARDVGIAFQNPDRQIFAGRVAHEVEFGPRNLGVGGAELQERVAAALTAVGLDARRDANPYDLGYSRRKLLALASILAMRTPIVILDEPTTGQDANGVRRVRAIVDDLARDGHTVLAISHDMRFVAESFARVIVMRAGRIVLDGTPDQVFDEPSWPSLASTYLEPPLAARIGARMGLGSTPTEGALIARAVEARRR